MTYKERLENIDKRAKHKVLGNIEGEIKYRLTEINTEDYEWLIKQAERAQELEQQNKNYRKVIKECVERMNAGGAGTRSFVYERLIEVLEGESNELG